MHPKYTAIFTSVNILLGVGPLILPYSFFQGGILLSSIWMLLIVILSYNSANYIVESMSKVSHLDVKEQSSTLQQSLLSSQQQQSKPLRQQQHQNNALFNSEETEENLEQRLLGDSHSNNEKASQPSSQQRISIDYQKQYDHIEQFSVLYGHKYRIFPALSVAIYLTGTAISKCIMTGNILSEVFHDIEVMNRFELWLGLFFISGAAFSFKSINDTKALQFIIIIARFISLATMLFGAVYLIIKNGPKSPTPKDGTIFNLSNFAQIFSNSLFSFLFHHSLPGIARPVSNTTDRTYFLKVSFIISGLILFIISISATFAFGDELGVHHYKYYSFDFNSQSETKFVYYILSFYVFFNIAAVSVYIIVVRTNILKIISPKSNPMVISKTTVIATIILLGIILIVALALKEYIQYVLDFTGGILGSVVLFYIPCLEVYKARKVVYRKGDVKNYLEKLPFVIMALGSIFMGFNLYEVIRQLLE